MPPSAQTDNPDQAFELLGGLLGSGRHADAVALAAQLSGLPGLGAARCGMIAEALATAGRNEEATAFLTRAASENIDHPGLHHALGSCLQAEGRFEEALKHYRHAISLCPHSEPSLCQAGSVLRKLGRTEEALECLGAAVRFNPDSAVALYNLDTDPGERKDVAAQHPKLVEELRALAAEGRRNLTEGKRPIGRLGDDGQLLKPAR
jgi:Flp pilus assembly protein TadD